MAPTQALAGPMAAAPAKSTFLAGSRRGLGNRSTPLSRAAAQQTQQRRQRQQQQRGAAAVPRATAADGSERNIMDTLSEEDFDEWDEVEGPPTPLLDTVNFPMHMKNFNNSQLEALCKEIRAELIHVTSKTGGHLGSSLGVVELSVAMHYVFNCPDDRFIFDVGHQAYPHKILTGRRDRMKTIRQTGGLSGFTKREESEYDAFGAGHSSTSISAALGMAVGSHFKGRKNNCLAVIGDGAITGGMAYEAMNHAGYLDKNMIVILNDNQQVSLPTQYNGANQPPVGALSSTLGRLQASKPLRELREIAKAATKQMPIEIQEATSKIDEYARGMISGSGSTLFEELGLYYIGPIDGHNLDDLVDVLKEVRDTETVGPVLIHVVTQKGRGYIPAETASDKMHGVVKFEQRTGKQMKPESKTMSYTNYFADSLTAEAKRDSRVVGIHAAMGGGTGMNRFEKHFPDRTFDVGIAEQHAVTFAAGLACEGLIPMVAIYSTFLQRGYDQVVHDVALQKLPVRFALDRGGMVGADGATHGGCYDISYLGCIPDMVLMAPSNEAELINMVATSIAIDDRPSAFRFPRGNGIGVDLAAEGIGSDLKGKVLEVGKGIVRREGEDVAFLCYGSTVNTAMRAAQQLEELGISATVADARFCKPLDTELVTTLAKEHPIMITVEEGSIGGFSAHVMQFLALKGLLDGNLKFRPMTMPDIWIEHGNHNDQLLEAGLTAGHLSATALQLLGKEELKGSVLMM